MYRVILVSRMVKYLKSKSTKHCKTTRTLLSSGKMEFVLPKKEECTACTGLLASVTRDDKIWQGSKYRGIVYYHFAYHFGGKFKLYLVSLLRYGNPTCAIDWFNVPNTVKRKLSFLKTFSKIWTVYHNFNIFSLF